MRLRLTLVAVLLCSVVLIAPSVGAKEDVKATLLSTITTTAVEGSQIDISWALEVEESGKPFNACAVFIRLIGPTGDSTEAFAECGSNAEGRYDATATVPSGGIAKVEIGVAGTMTDREGHSERSDWLMPLTNAPSGD
jgi:hypothetical protein